jgi:hypothetical protein
MTTELHTLLRLLAMALEKTESSEMEHSGKNVLVELSRPKQPGV